MEIIIRTDGRESNEKPPSVETFNDATASPRGRAGGSTASAVEQVALVDAINAGPAPAPPEHSGGPPVNVVASEYRHAETDTALSAGPAANVP